MRKLLWVLAGFMALTLSGCGYNDFQTKDEQVKAAWAEVLNQYKRRADLIPNSSRRYRATLRTSARHSKPS